MKEFILGIFYRGIILPIALVLIIISLFLFPLYWIISKRSSVEDIIGLIHYNTNLDKYL